MSVYRVHFKWKEKDIQIKAASLDLTHPYFVSIKDLIFNSESKLIIDPSEDDVRRFFGKAEHLMIPFQTVSLIEELKEEEKPAKKMVNFKLIDNQETEDEL